MAWGKKLLLSLSVFDIMLRKHLPDGSKKKRWLPGWFESLVILAALLLQRLRLISCREGRADPDARFTLQAWAARELLFFMFVCIDCYLQIVKSCTDWTDCTFCLSIQKKPIKNDVPSANLKWLVLCKKKKKTLIIGELHAFEVLVKRLHLQCWHILHLYSTFNIY